MFVADKNKTYDLVLVGTGFASSFFLKKYLEKAASNVSVLVLERGPMYRHAWQRENQEHLARLQRSGYLNKNPAKPWIHSPFFGGGSNCWWACTPRFMPNDFKLKTLYGIGRDWPVTYDELESYYTEAEEIMQIAGPSNSPQPRSKPYPQSAHVLTAPDLLLQKARPHEIFALPSARARTATANRARCCAVGFCGLCPVDAKFTVLNEMQRLYKDPRVTLVLGAKAERLLTQGNIGKSLVVKLNGEDLEIQGSLFALGANALFNPYLLLNSGIRHPLLGTHLHEQRSVKFTLDLRGLDNFQGSTSLTAHGYQRYDGQHRKDEAACLMETSNIPEIRLEHGKWRQRLEVKFIFEDLPSEKHRVTLGEQGMPNVEYFGETDYCVKAKRWVYENLSKLLSPLPIEKLVSSMEQDTESHILGTTVMGADSNTAVIDKFLKLYQYSNVLSLGGGAFPTCSPANPTLTICALSLWAADRL